MLCWVLLFIWQLGQAAASPELIIDGYENSQVLTATGSAGDFQVGQVLAVKSKSAGIGFIGYARINKIDGVGSKAKVEAELVRSSPYHLIRPGDSLTALDLSSATQDYVGSTELLVREYAPRISNRFKPLLTQGILIGETAQTLWQNEFLFTWYGLAHYGLVDWMSLGTLLPDDITNSPNMTVKVRLIDTASNTIATGVTVRRIPQEQRYTVNWNMMWDSFNNAKSMSHTFATLAIYSIENAQDTTAFKSAGTSTFQTGYEHILDNWSRILFGPNYNFETKAVGGYMAYTKIWDHFHLQATLYSTNVRSLKWSLNDGYLVYMDAYWRF